MRDDPGELVYTEDIEKLMELRDDLSSRLDEVNSMLRGITGLPEGWRLCGKGESPLAGSIAFTGLGSCEHGGVDDSPATICIYSGSQYGSGFFIVDDELGRKSVIVDPAVVKAALDIFYSQS